MSSSILSKALQATSLLASTTLLALSIATVALVTHYSESMDASYPEGSYTYYGPVGSPARRAYWEEYDAGNRDFNKVYMQYVTSNDIWVLVSGCVGLVAGVVGWLTVAFMMMKEKNPKTAGSRFPWVLACSIFFGLAAFAMSLTSTIITFETKKRLEREACVPSAAYSYYNPYFDCTRELAACSIFEMLSSGYDDHSQQICSEAQASRRMLIPTLVCAVVLVSTWIAQAIVSKKGADAEADRRVQDLQEQEEAE
ncbi:uncharacterized protein J4E87_006448 [Alternaria ethzedia]|uniref:uncharacterized protein n=1 Tax=Alternaria ethzedia TaxID=181014 RepID=UPI0020C44BA9|nr:uncharacterized protein J4E87_006448 [Alternaria ethzedia]KAI4622506.1 hypothetical protein J4E87_006448 [Alternaria ethzedia]